MLDHKHYLAIADTEAELSHDLSTKIGAVIVLHSDIYALGHNDIPDDVIDLPDRRERPTKYLYTEHAERAAIYQAARVGDSIEGAILYTQGVPCADCARAIILSGIIEVVVRKVGSGLEGTERWTESVKAGEQMLLEAGVVITRV